MFPRAVRWVKRSPGASNESYDARWVRRELLSRFKLPFLLQAQVVENYPRRPTLVHCGILALSGNRVANPVDAREACRVERLIFSNHPRPPKYVRIYKLDTTVCCFLLVLHEDYCTSDIGFGQNKRIHTRRANVCLGPFLGSSADTVF